MEKLRELVVAYIAKTQGKTPEEVSSLLFKKNEADQTEVLVDGAIDALLNLDKGRMQAVTQKFDTEKKELYDKGYNKAKAEELGKFEKQLREKYQITEDKIGVELVDAILAKQATGNNTGEPTEDQIKRSKVYLDTLAKLKQEKDDVEKTWNEKFSAREKALQKEAAFKTVSEQALTLLDGLKPIFPDETKSKEWKDVFLSRLNDFDFEVKEDGKTIVVLKKDNDGNTKAFLDEHGHPVSFDSIVKEKAGSLFSFQQGESRSGAGNNNGGGSGAGKGAYTGPVPKTEQEYMKLISETKDEDTAIQITKSWQATQAKL